MGTVAVAAGAAAIKLGKEVVKEFGELNKPSADRKPCLESMPRPFKRPVKIYKNMGVSQSRI